MATLSDSYVYTLQGLMHARGVDAPNNHLPPASLEVNQAGAVLQQFFDPFLSGNVDPGRTRPAADLLHLPGFNASATLLPNGYYPFSETGYMTFHTDHTVTGVRRINTAGYLFPGSSFKGAFRYDPPPPPSALSANRTGIITTQRDDQPQLVRDYTFVMVSDDEVQLAAGAHVPRPGVATGTMKKFYVPGRRLAWPFGIFLWPFRGNH